MTHDNLKTIELILDLKAMLHVYVEGKQHNESYTQAIATICEANKWLQELKSAAVLGPSENKGD